MRGAAKISKGKPDNRFLKRIFFPALLPNIVVVLGEIINITSEGYKGAVERLNNNVLMSVEIAEKYINRINELLPLVQEYNKQLASWYVSEGSMDLLYACGKTDNTSLRIGRYK